MKRFLVAGIGNIFFGDDAFGCNGEQWFDVRIDAARIDDGSSARAIGGGVGFVGERGASGGAEAARLEARFGGDGVSRAKGETIAVAFSALCPLPSPPRGGEGAGILFRCSLRL